jgi:hypothetical protein
MKKNSSATGQEDFSSFVMDALTKSGGLDGIKPATGMTPPPPPPKLKSDK